MECATDILNKYLEDKSKAAPAAATKDKRKTLSSKDAAEQRSQELVQAAAFAALRTRPSVDSALWEVRIGPTELPKNSQTNEFFCGRRLSVESYRVSR
jgi:hypothetical protein